MFSESTVIHEIILLLQFGREAKHSSVQQKCLRYRYREMMPYPNGTPEEQYKSPSHKRRALLNIVNLPLDRKMEKVESGRQHLGFEMARITLPGGADNLKSNIPAPPKYGDLTYRRIRDKNRKSSNIPAPKSASRSDFDMDHVHKLVDLNKTFSERVNSEKGTRPKESALRATLRNMDKPVKRESRHDIDEEEEYLLDSQIRDTNEKIDELEFLIVELKRNQKKLSNRIVDIDQNVSSQRKAFSMMEESVMKSVSHKEQLINMQIKELSNKLTQEYDELKFQLEDELVKAKSYEDSAIREEIKKLEDERNSLILKLEERTEHKRKILEQETKALDVNLDSHLKVKVEEVDALEVQYKAQQKDCDIAAKKLTDLKKKAQEIQDDNEKISNSIKSLESNMENFSIIRSNLLSDLSDEETKLRELERVNNSWDTRLAQAEKAYKERTNEIERHEQFRRIVENAIMDHKGKIRTYVKADEAQIKFEKDSKIVFKNKCFQFDKCFPLSCENEVVIKEFQTLTNMSISDTNTSVIFTGKRNEGLFFESLLCTSKGLLVKSFQLSDKNWDFELYMQYIAFGESPLDLLNTCETAKIDVTDGTLDGVTSRKMAFRSISDITEVMEKIEFPGHALLNMCIITVEGKNEKQLKQFTSHVMLLDLTRHTFQNQKELLSCPKLGDNENGQLKMIDYAFWNSKCLLISNVDSGDDSDTMDMLEVLELVHSTDSPYKRKN